MLRLSDSAALSWPYMNRKSAGSAGKVEFQSMYRQGDCTDVDLLIDFCTTALSDIPHLISAVNFSQQLWSVYSDSKEVPTLSEYNSSVGRFPPLTLNVWMGELGKFFSFNPLVE